MYKELYIWKKTENSDLNQCFEMKVLHGHTCLYVQGIDDSWFGSIYLLPEFNPDTEPLHASEKFSSSDECKKHLEKRWKRIIHNEFDHIQFDS